MAEMTTGSPPDGAGPTPGCASWLELSARALRDNVALFRQLPGPGTPAHSLGAVLKGNAYGHGFAQMLPLVHDLVDVLYVIAPQDALAIREWERAGGHARRQVLVIGATVAGEAIALARAGVDAVIADTSWAEMVPHLRAARLPHPLRVHVHLDTGLGREGFTLAQLPGEVAFLRDCADVLQVVGTLSHFANTEDVTEQAYANAQVDAFDQALARLRGAIPHDEPLQRHMAASAASLALPRSRYEAVRIGIALYGLWPSPETRLSTRLVLGYVPTLHPVLRWRCPSQVVKWLPAGSYVGYGCTYRCSEPTRVAVLPVGYYDGYPRLLSGRAHVLVNGRRCPVLGRVMMNHVVVDVTRAVADERPIVATLLGSDGDESVSAETMAGWAQTISYELVSRIGPHLRRVVVP